MITLEQFLKFKEGDSMITLEQFIKLVPYYQDYEIVHYNDIAGKYVRIMDSSAYTVTYNIDDYMNFMNTYGKWFVVNVEAGRGEILNICIESR